MLWVALLFAALALVSGGVLLYRRARSRRVYEASSMTPQTLNALMQSGQSFELFDVRLPLDVLADAEIIPGAKRVSPGEIRDNPALLPQDHDTIVYCTCPSDETSQRIALRVRALGYTRVCFLRGGLAAWRAAGFPVQPYTESFQLNPVS